jgi:hypothetical protein
LVSIATPNSGGPTAPPDRNAAAPARRRLGRISADFLPDACRSAVHGLLRQSIRAGRVFAPGATAVTLSERGMAVFPGRPYAVFVVFNLQPRVPRYVRAHIEALARHRINTVVVSNNRRLPGSEVARLLPHCYAYLARFNLGYDFGAYRDGVVWLASTDGPPQSAVFFMNDSVLGPFGDYGVLLDRVAGEERPMLFGLTDSLEHRYHLQTYWFAVTAAGVQSPRFWRYWRRMSYARNKQEAIARRELRLTQDMSRMGLAVEALFSYTQVQRAAIEYFDRLMAEAASHLGELDTGLAAPFEDQLMLRARIYQPILRMLVGGTNVNPSFFLWEPLIARLGFPFLKREVLMQAGGRTPFWGAGERLIAERGLPRELIQDCMQSTLLTQVAMPNFG